MKIVIDPIYTGDVRKCASAVKMKRVVEGMLEDNPDLYVYWFIPEDIDDESRDWLPDDPRIAYHTASYSDDRLKEYMRF